MVFSATFNSTSAISWRSVLLVEETVVSRENHPPAASTPCHEFELTTLVVIGTDCIGSCKSNFPYDHDNDDPPNI